MKIFKVSKSRHYVKQATSCLVIAAFAALIVTSPLAYSGNDHTHCKYRLWNHENHGEHFQQRQQELHEKLSLTVDQEAAWSIFVEKTKPSEKNNKSDLSALSRLSTPERMDRLLARVKEREQQYEVLVQATKDLYKQLTPAQQKIFDTSHQYHENEHSHDRSH